MTRAGMMAVMLCAVAGMARADWVQLDGAAIAAALTDVELIYDTGAVQRFYASGRTFYDDARPSWGYWRVEGGQYCSQWPPSDHWACYDVHANDAGGVRFVGAAGDAYLAEVREE